MALFVERAVTVGPSFALTPHNAAVVQLCHRLDGIPLAIELAAARVNVLSVEQMTARLNQRFRLLTGGARTALPRQQTLRAAIDWSYDLLTEPERAVLRRLAIFAGGRVLEAAEAVCAGEDIGAWEVLDLLARLVDKSLVVAEDQGGEIRYRLLETVRQYALERLEAGEVGLVQQCHRDWYLALAEQAEGTLHGGDQLTWLARLEVEHDNLRAAMDWSRQAAGEAEAGLRLAAALWHFWEIRGHISEGRYWLEAMLKAGGDADEAWRAKALTGAGTMAWLQADYAQALTFHEQALALYRMLGDQPGLAFSLNCIGWQAMEQGDYSRGLVFFNESLSLGRTLEDRYIVTIMLHNLGELARRQGEYERAAGLFGESLEMSREFGQVIIASSKFGLGTVSVDRTVQAA